MVSFSKINPMARAIGTMAAVFALVGGVTFAALQSNTAALDPNTLSSESAQLTIAEVGNCGDSIGTTIPGLDTALVPGVASAPRTFCLNNQSDIPLTITAQIPNTFENSQIAPSDVTLTLTCDNIGVLSGPLTAYSSPVAFPNGKLGANTIINCTETATLASTYSGSGGQTVNSFAVRFVGNQ